jgi:hypothetical protein
MNCCDDHGGCRQGRDCPVRRQPAYPATLPPELPVWPERAPQPRWRRRLRSVASAAGYAAMTMLAFGAALLMAHIWAEWLTG